MRFFVFLWAAVEILQLAFIGALLVGYRKLQRRLDDENRFTTNPPRSVTEE